MDTFRSCEVAYIIRSCTLYSLITKTNWQGQLLSIGSNDQNLQFLNFNIFVLETGNILT